MTRRQFDHFHAELRLADGASVEVEGGWLGLPEGWSSWPDEQRDAWMLTTAKSWAPDGVQLDGASIQAFRLAG